MILSNRLAPCVDPRSLADFQSAPLVVPAGKCREIRFDESPPPPLGRIPPCPSSNENDRLPSIRQKRRKIGEKSLTHGGTFTRRFLRLVPPFVLLETQHTRGILTNRATHEFGGTPLDTDRRRSSSRARSTVVAEPLGRDGWASIARPSAWTRRDRRRLTATKRTVNEARVARRGRHLSLPTYGDCYPRSCARVRERGGSRWWLVAWRHALD